MSNVYVHFSLISFPARYSVVNLRLESHSLRFREVIVTLVTRHSRGFTHVKFVDAAQTQTWDCLSALFYFINHSKETLCYKASFPSLPLSILCALNRIRLGNFVLRNRFLSLRFPFFPFSFLFLRFFLQKNRGCRILNP